MPAGRSETDPRRARAERILDAAAELLVRWGYKRVTVEEVAKRASVGKGTVYLHWKTREALLFAAVLRESVEVIGEIIEQIQRDPDRVRLSHLVHSAFLAHMSRPLIRAMLTRDVELLGALAEQGAGTAFHAEDAVLRREYYGLLREHGLMRTDTELDRQIYTISATAMGFYLNPSLLGSEDLSLADRADLLATTIRNAFEPAEGADPEAVRALAPKVIQFLEQLRALAEQELNRQHQP
jgi:AcrR family transcriptional regulator